MSDPENPNHPTGVRRWGAYLVLVVVFAIACGLLSWWQWDRRAETLAQGTLVTRNYESTPVPIDTLLPSLGSWRAGEEWRPVRLHGRYLGDQQLLVRNRVFNANPGFEVLVPFELDDGRVFVVTLLQVEVMCDDGGCGQNRPGSGRQDPSRSHTCKHRNAQRQQCGCNGLLQAKETPGELQEA